jgi:hypothetical protein
MRQRNILPLSSGCKSKPRNNQAYAGGKLALAYYLVLKMEATCSSETSGGP